MKTSLILPLIIALGNCAVAQPVNPLPVPAFTRTYSVKFNDAFSMINNPAALVSYRWFTAGVHTQRRYMLPEPAQYIIAAGCPLKHAGIGIQLNYLRSGAFRQSEAAVAYAKKLGNIDIGARFNYHRVSITAYGNTSAIVVDAGSTWHITDDLHAGVHVYNPFGGRLSYRYNAGFGYEVSAQVLLTAQVSKTEDKPANIHAGLHYQPVQRLFMQAGIATATGETFLGAAYQVNQWQVLVSVSYHSQLGYTPSLSLIYKSQRS